MAAAPWGVTALPMAQANAPPGFDVNVTNPRQKLLSENGRRETKIHESKKPLSHPLRDTDSSAVTDECRESSPLPVEIISKNLLTH